MKERPSLKSFLLTKVEKILAPPEIKRAFSEFADAGLVKLGFLPEKMDGRGKILHISDTPTNMYGYLARTLRRIDPSVAVHTGDLADDVKLGLYPSEAGRYAAAARRLLNILAAPHRKVILVLGNHDSADLLPPLPSGCVVYDGAAEIELFGADFRIAHHVEKIMEKPVQYNLYGHNLSRRSFVDGEGRYFFNGLELMRLIDPVAGEIKTLVYPRGAADARMMRGGRRSR
jgi:predicted phosphodiesterase